MPLNELVARLESALPSMLADLEALITVESPSADLAAVATSAQAVAEVGRARLGIAPETIEIDGRTHLRWRLGAQPARVLVLGHHDTVWPKGSLATHPFALTDGVLRGPGCLDMKSGLVMAFHAIASLADPSGVTLLVTGDEEVGSPTSRSLIESEALGCVAALVLEASADGGALKLERKGGSIYELQVRGRAAHAGLDPEGGVNATIELAHQILALSELAGGDPGTSVTPTLLSAGTTANTVPDAGLLVVDVRATTTSELERVDAGIRALRPVLPGAHLDIGGGINRPPLEAAASAGLFAMAAEVAARLELPPVRGTAVGGASDGNFTAAMGTPTLDGLGGTGGGAHADDEHVVVAEIPRRTALLAGLVEALLGRAVTSEPTNVGPVSVADPR